MSTRNDEIYVDYLGILREHRKRMRFFLKEVSIAFVSTLAGGFPIRSTSLAIAAKEALPKTCIPCSS